MMVMAAGPVSMAVSMAMLVIMIMIAVRGVVSVMVAHGPGLGPVAPVR